MTPTGETKVCTPPSDALPPTGYKWSGKWKIEVSKETDSYGWVEEGGGVKRRRWLRLVKKQKAGVRLDGPATLISEGKASSSAFNSTNVTAAGGEGRASRETKKLTNLVSRKIKDVQDDWNWKGFGWSFYKSILYPEAGGVR